jgi:hypothetical protein
MELAIFEPFIFQSLRIDELPRVVDLLVQAFDLHGTAATARTEK